MKVAVTGASGLVGSHLVGYLASKGHIVYAVTRSNEALYSFQDDWSALKVIPIQANVLDGQSLMHAFSGVDVVVHAAGMVDPYGKREEIFVTNVGGTKNALEAARKQQVKQFILVSSLSVISGLQDQFDVDESALLRPTGESYADSKIEAERTVMSNISSAPAITIVRPGFIYGPRERAWLPRLINSIATGKAMLIDGGHKQTNVIYVQNLNAAIEGALLNERAFGQVYNLTDGQRITKKVLFDTISDGLHLPRVTNTVPFAVARCASEIISSIAPFLPVDQQRKLARYSRAAFRLAGINQGFSIAKAETDLNYINRVPFAAGMSETLSYFRASGNVGSKVGEAKIVSKVQ